MFLWVEVCNVSAFLDRKSACPRIVSKARLQPSSSKTSVHYVALLIVGPPIILTQKFPYNIMLSAIIKSLLSSSVVTLNHRKMQKRRKNIARHLHWEWKDVHYFKAREEQKPAFVETVNNLFATVFEADEDTYSRSLTGNRAWAVTYPLLGTILVQTKWCSSSITSINKENFTTRAMLSE